MKSDSPIAQLEQRGIRRGSAKMAADVAQTLRARRRNRVALAALLVAVVGLGALLSTLRDNTPSDLDVLDGPTDSSTNTDPPTTDPTTTATIPATSLPPLEISGDGSAAAAMAVPEAAWQADPIADYFLRIEPGGPWRGQVYVSQVVDGAAIATIVEEDGLPHPALTDGSKWTPTTVEELYGLLRSYSDVTFPFAPPSGGSTFRATFDPSGRWPTHISLDPIINAIDDEQVLSITMTLERPAIFGDLTVPVLIATDHVLPGIALADLLTSVTAAGVPESIRPETALTRDELEGLEGSIARREIRRNEIIVAEMFVDPAEMFPDQIPDGMIIFSMLHELEDGLDVGDAVVVVADSETVDARIIAIGTNPGIVTLLLHNTDAHLLASSGPDYEVTGAP